MMTYNDPHMTVMMTVTEIQTSVTLVCHWIQNMTMTMLVAVIKKCCCHKDLAVTFNNAAPCNMQYIRDCQHSFFLFFNAIQLPMQNYRFLLDSYKVFVATNECQFIALMAQYIALMAQYIALVAPREYLCNISSAMSIHKIFKFEFVYIYSKCFFYLKWYCLINVPWFQKKN